MKKLFTLLVVGVFTIWNTFANQDFINNYFSDYSGKNNGYITMNNLLCSYKKFTFEDLSSQDIYLNYNTEAIFDKETWNNLLLKTSYSSNWDIQYIKLNHSWMEKITQNEFENNKREKTEKDLSNINFPNSIYWLPQTKKISDQYEDKEIISVSFPSKWNSYQAVYLDWKYFYNVWSAFYSNNWDISFINTANFDNLPSWDLIMYYNCYEAISNTKILKINKLLDNIFSKTEQRWEEYANTTYSALMKKLNSIKSSKKETIFLIEHIKKYLIQHKIWEREYYSKLIIN